MLFFSQFITGVLGCIPLLYSPIYSHSCMLHPSTFFVFHIPRHFLHTLLSIVSGGIAVKCLSIMPRELVVLGSGFVCMLLSWYLFYWAKWYLMIQPWCKTPMCVFKFIIISTALKNLHICYLFLVSYPLCSDEIPLFVSLSM